MTESPIYAALERHCSKYVSDPTLIYRRPEEFPALEESPESTAFRQTPKVDHRE